MSLTPWRASCHRRACQGHGGSENSLPVSLPPCQAPFAVSPGDARARGYDHRPFWCWIPQSPGHPLDAKGSDDGRVPGGAPSYPVVVKASNPNNPRRTQAPPVNPGRALTSRPAKAGSATDWSHDTAQAGVWSVERDSRRHPYRSPARKGHNYPPVLAGPMPCGSEMRRSPYTRWHREKPEYKPDAADLFIAQVEAEAEDKARMRAAKRKRTRGKDHRERRWINRSTAPSPR